jgi:hypothetical protein
MGVAAEYASSQDVAALEIVKPNGSIGFFRKFRENVAQPFRSPCRSEPIAVSEKVGSGRWEVARH